MDIDSLHFAPPPVRSSAPAFSNGGTIRQKRTLVTINSAVTDVATFSGLPSKYLITAFRVFDASTSLAASAATLGLFTAAGGAGTAIVAAAVLTTLTAASKTAGMAIAVPNDYQTAATLYVRNVIAHGVAATVTVQLEIIDLS